MLCSEQQPVDMGTHVSLHYWLGLCMLRVCFVKFHMLLYTSLYRYPYYGGSS